MAVITRELSTHTTVDYVRAGPGSIHYQPQAPVGGLLRLDPALWLLVCTVEEFSTPPSLPHSLPAGSVCFLLAPGLLGQEQGPAPVVWLSGSSNILVVWMLGVGFTQGFGRGSMCVWMCGCQLGWDEEVSSVKPWEEISNYI